MFDDKGREQRAEPGPPCPACRTLSLPLERPLGSRALQLFPINPAESAAFSHLNVRATEEKLRFFFVLHCFKMFLPKLLFIFTRTIIGTRKEAGDFS